MLLAVIVVIDREETLLNERIRAGQNADLMKDCNYTCFDVTKTFDWLAEAGTVVGSSLSDAFLT
jgi:hypothetical protein